MNKKGFTLMEILIVVAVIGLIAGAVIMLLNPFTQLEKAYDAKRKKDLSLLKKAIEEWYNDKGCYPKPEEICYTPLEDVINVCELVGTNPKPVGSQICNICGDEPDSPSFSPYLERLPCDPLHDKYKYVYEVEARPGIPNCSFSGDATHTCASWYKVYSSLFNKEDRDATALGCIRGGCGLSSREVFPPIITEYPSGYGFSYGISSPNTRLSYSNQWFCQIGAGFNSCDVCGASYAECFNYVGCNQWGNNIHPGIKVCNASI